MEKSIDMIQSAAGHRDQWHEARLSVFTASILLSVLFIVSRHHFLLFHVLAELFSVTVAWSLFLLQWNTRQFSRNDALTFLGTIYFFSGSINLAHMLAYSGMGFVPAVSSPNIATQTWIAARCLEAAGLLLYALRLNSRIPLWVAIAGGGIYTALAFMSIFAWGIFPDCYIAGKGLTGFKIGMEYAICLILAITIAILKRKRDQVDAPFFRLIITAIGFMMAAELAFTLYIDAYGLSNIIGHFFKIISFFFVYLALVRYSLKRPYTTLFKELERDKQALQASEKKYRGLIETAHDVIYTVDRSGRILMINSPLAGISPQEIIGTDVAAYILPEYQDMVHSKIQRVFATGLSEFQETQAHGPNGSATWHETKLSAIYEDQSVSGVLMITRDVTTRKQNEVALRDTTRLLTGVLDGIPDAIGMQYPDHTIIRYNKAGYEALGMSREEVDGQPCYTLIGRNGPCEDCQTYPAMKTKTLQAVERFIPKLGKHFLCRSNPILDDEGHVVLVVEQLHDITDRKKAEQALQVREQYLRKILETTVDGFFVADHAGKLVDVNEAYCAMSGYSRAELLQMTIRDLDCFESPEVMKARLDHIVKKGFDIFETKHRRKDGREFPVEASATFFNDGTGKYIAFCRDITERKRSEDALESRLMTLTQPLAEMADISFSDLFDMQDIQEMQDKFSENMGVGSIITDLDGKPVTVPSNFCRICQDIIRNSDKGLNDCYHYASRIKDVAGKGPVVQKCMGGSILHAGAKISVAGKHIANWLIGHVREAGNYDEDVCLYARNIGADEEAMVRAYREVPVMPYEQFSRAAETLCTFASQLSTTAYHNVQQARFIAEQERNKAEDAFLAGLGRITGSTLNTEEIFSHVAVEVQKLIPSDRMALILLNAKDGQAIIAHETGFPVFSRKIGDIFRIDGSIIGDIASARTGLLIQPDDVEEIRILYPNLADQLALKSRSMIIAPLISQDTVIGFMTFWGTSTGKFDEKDLRLTERIGVQIAGAIANAQLFNECKIAEHITKERERTLSTLIDNLPGFIYRCANDHDWTMEIISDQCLDITGYTADDFLQNRITYNDIVDPAYRQPLWDKWQEAIQRKEKFEWEYPIIHANGNTLWVWERGQGIYDDEGHLLFLEGFITDVTQRKLALEEKEKWLSQFVQAQKMESIGRLAGGVAHDFNNMLGVIFGHAELALKRTKPSERVYRDIQGIIRAAERSADLTRQLLAFARKQVIAPKVLDLNDTVEGMLKMLRRLIGEDIELSWRPGVAPSPVRMDPSQIDQLLANLCVNARDAIAGIGTVSIETGNITFDDDYCKDRNDFIPGDYVMLSVADTGSGMTKETVERIFEPFFTTKEQGKGTGLGLSTVYGIVKQNNGFINVASEPGQGSIFRIYLPRLAGEIEQLQESQPPEPAARGQETILLVEDEPEMLKVVTMLLRRQGYSVLAAATPGDAMHLADTYRGEIDLLVTDVIMPEMNGRNLATILQSRYPSLKLLFMSGYTADVIASHGVLDKGVHFIQKPFTIGNISAKVREALTS